MDPFPTLRAAYDVTTGRGGCTPPGRIAAEFSRRPSSGSFVVITGGCVEPAGGAIPRRLLNVPPFLPPLPPPSSLPPPLVPYSPSRGGCALSIPLGETPRRLHQPVNIVIVYDILNVNELARPSPAVCFECSAVSVRAVDPYRNLVSRSNFDRGV